MNLARWRFIAAAGAALTMLTAVAGDFTMDGGLYRDVCLWAVDPLEVQMLDYAGPGVYLRQQDLSSTSASVDVTTKLANDGAVPVPGTPEEYAAVIDSDEKKWAPIVKSLNLKFE